MSCATPSVHLVWHAVVLCWSALCVASGAFAAREALVRRTMVPLGALALLPACLAAVVEVGWRPRSFDAWSGLYAFGAAVLAPWCLGLLRAMAAEEPWSPRASLFLALLAVAVFSGCETACVSCAVESGEF